MIRYPLYLLFAVFVGAASGSGWDAVPDGDSFTSVSLTCVDKTGDGASDFVDKLYSNPPVLFSPSILGKPATNFYCLVPALASGPSWCHSIRAPPAPTI